MSKLSTNSEMSAKNFRKLLQRYGADLSRWTQVDAASARALLAESSAMRAIYRDAELLDRALDQVEVPALPAGLSTRAANEALLRSGRKQMYQQPHHAAQAARRTYAAQSRRAAPLFASALAVFFIVLAAWPAGRGPADVTKFLHTMDKIATRTNQELRDADDVLGMLTVADSAANNPEHADEDGQVTGKMTGEELINTLFDNDAAEDADGASL